MGALTVAYTDGLRDCGIEGVREFLERPRPGVWYPAVSKLPEPRLTDSSSQSESTPTSRRKRSRLQIGDSAIGHALNLAKSCEPVKQPIENSNGDNAAVEEIKAVLAKNLDALIKLHYRGSQNALAKASKVAQTTIGNYLHPDSYKGAPQLDKVAKLARALHLKEAYLLLVPGMVVGKRGPATEGEIEEEVQKRVLSKWRSITRELEGLRVAHERENGPPPPHPPAPGKAKKESPQGGRKS